MLVLNFKELKQKRIQNKNKKQIQVGFHRWLVYFKFIQIISYSGQYLFFGNKLLTVCEKRYVPRNFE